jgi:hypothetical protein
MSTQKNSAQHGVDGTKTSEKGESQQSNQKGAPSVSGKNMKHTKDESGGGSDKNTTKKQQNSI